LRWFTPEVEVDLCGHATVASAHVIFDLRREVAGKRVSFQSKSGELGVERISENGHVLYALDFPARPPQPVEGSPDLEQALGATPRQVLKARDYMCVFGSEDEVLALKPDMAKLAALDCFAVIVTAPGKDCDFVSRFFAPAKGVDEDPVTGSAHCTLIPYWAKRLGKSNLFARQRSRRGGELWCEHRGDRVSIAGRAVKFSEGTIELEAF
jgi:PhzF family phenazine biosynthesis protein